MCAAWPSTDGPHTSGLRPEPFFRGALPHTPARRSQGPAALRRSSPGAHCRAPGSCYAGTLVAIPRRTETGDAPGQQGASRKHTGRMRPRSNAVAGCSAGRMQRDSCSGLPAPLRAFTVNSITTTSSRHPMCPGGELGRHPGVTGRPGGNRTPNPRFWRPVLCQLSYWPVPGEYPVSEVRHPIPERGAPPDCVAPQSQMPNLVLRRALQWPDGT